MKMLLSEKKKIIEIVASSKKLKRLIDNLVAEYKKVKIF